MSDSPYRTSPRDVEGMPPGIPYIVSNEAAERFSFYGMKVILVVFMTEYLLKGGAVAEWGALGSDAPMGGPEAKVWFHSFSSAVYALPLLGALISDVFWGKYRTILVLSIVYCLGHLALALDETRTGLLIGLGLIALGAGGIKPCVSAHVGDQFGPKNHHLLSKVFGWFYFSINLGAVLAQTLIPEVLRKWGPGWAFGIPGILMAFATFAFWKGRHKFIHVPAGGVQFLKETFSKTGISAMLKLCAIYIFLAPFWALFDQTGSAWVLQAKQLDRHFLGREWLPDQLQALNPLLILVYIPLFTYVLYPALARAFSLTPLRKIGIGLFLTVPAFLLPAWLAMRIEAGDVPSIGWQFLAYVIITAAEVFVSITCLEFSYTQAPHRMKSLIMGLFMLSVALGNLFTAAVNHFIQNDDGSTWLSDTEYYLFFSAVMAVTAVLFIPVAMWFKERRYIHGVEVEAAA